MRKLKPKPNRVLKAYSGLQMAKFPISESVFLPPEHVIESSAANQSHSPVFLMF